MSFKINDIKFYKQPPNNTTIDNILVNYKTNLNEIEEGMKNYNFIRQETHQGFQIELGNQLEDLFKKLFEKKGLFVSTRGREVRYSSRIDLRADIVVKNLTHATNKGIYVEIEFRPNEFKDIVKFEIGHKNMLTDLGILVVAQNRDNINPGYTTMPEFRKCKDIIKELKPRCPMLLIGIDGEKF